MIGPVASHYSIPRDWQMFERLCIALLSDMFATPFHRWGRNGQRQDGVDIYGRTASQCIAVQCKGRLNGLGKPLRQKEIDAICQEIDASQLPVSQILILTTLSDDVALHAWVQQKTQQRIMIGLCPVDVWGWETLSDYIGRSPKVQKDFYGYLRPQDNFKQRLWTITTFTLIVGLTIFAGMAGWKYYQQQQLTSVERLNLTLDTLEQMGDKLRRLDRARSQCGRTLASGNFSFSYALKKQCMLPVSTILQETDELLEQRSSVLSAELWEELQVQRDLLHEDQRQLLVAHFATNSAEEGIVRNWQFQCSVKKPDDNTLRSNQTGARQDFTNALHAQSRFYFTVRDFIAGEIDALKARNQAFSRQLKMQTVPEELARRANSLQALQKQRGSWDFKPTAQPLTDAMFRAFQSRDYTSSGTPDAVEEARWRELYAKALLNSLVGRKKEIEQLIRCGLLSKQARSLNEKPAYE